MIRWILLPGILLPTVILTVGFGSREFWVLALAALAIGLLWLALEAIRRPEFGGYGFAGLGFLAGVGVYDGLSPVLMLLSLTAVLCAWDVSRFQARIARSVEVEDRRRLEKLHLRKLGLTAAAGLALGLLALAVRFSLTLLPVILLALLAAISLRQAVLPRPRRPE